MASLDRVELRGLLQRDRRAARSGIGHAGRDNLGARAAPAAVALPAYFSLSSAAMACAP